jgi:hypothetical protein
MWIQAEAIYMNTEITIQNLDDATEEWIREEAGRRGVTVDQLLLELIQTGISVERQSPPIPAYDDLDSLAGTWTEEQATEFLNAIDDFELVDEKLWR